MEVLGDQNMEQNVTLISSENNMEDGEKDSDVTAESVEKSQNMEEAELVGTEIGTAESEREKTTDNSVEVEEGAVEPETTTEKVETSVDLESLSQPEEEDTLCKACGKHIHPMDKIVADETAFHKSCFCCKECGNSLNIDNYISHGRDIYCQHHYEQHYQPKVDSEEKLEDDSKKGEVRNVHNLDERSQFEDIHPGSTEDETPIKRKEGIQDRMTRYQAAMSKDHQNDHQAPSSEKEEQASARINNDEIKQLSNLQGTERSSLMRAAYEQACKESSSVSPTCGESIALGREIKAVSIKEKFEKGVLDQESNEKMEKVRREKEEDLSIVSETRDSVAGARTLFKQYDTVSTKATSLLPGRSSYGEPKRPRELMYGAKTTTAKEVVKCSEPGAKEQVDLEPAELQERFNYFENYKETKPQLKSFPANEEVPRDPKVVRASDVQEEVMGTDTAKRMLDKFKQLESQSAGSSTKPMIKASPLKETAKVPEKQWSSPEPQHNPDIVRCTYKVEDDMTWKADQARNLKAKFEQWDNEVERENKIADDEGLPESDTTKNLRAKFEAIRAESNKTVEKPQPRGKKFAELGLRSGEECDLCGKKLYPMEKMEASGFKFHRNCFRCSHCKSLLRLDNYTINSRKFYCTPHFKQYFKSKGSYEDGFINNDKKEPNENSNASGYTNGNTCDVKQVTMNQEVAV
ncbi:F-actin-methionine sulfoxide oxidase mical1-like [Limulus polyphemus]|uniref:F-actin-methionine sulfoxide oxidase mical1-like n=1 Tax=Limulus polyphemus TaxID=6850 RepID=A0ABM1BN07_LIMPO|nr:F-actin-methionine sulfoxide oxidase mical1-like [Limulus polyphemus]